MEEDSNSVSEGAPAQSIRRLRGEKSGPSVAPGVIEIKEYFRNVHRFNSGGIQLNFTKDRIFLYLMTEGKSTVTKQ